MKVGKLVLDWERASESLRVLLIRSITRVAYKFHGYETTTSNITINVSVPQDAFDFALVIAAERVTDLAHPCSHR